MSKNVKRILCFLLTLSITMSLMCIIPVFDRTVNAVTGTTYYVSTTGNDLNDGLSTLTPWQHLSKINEKTFKPGDKILLKSGDVWNNETISLTESNGSGTAADPIVLTSYGAGLKPKISSSAVNVVLLKNLTNWQVRGLDVYSSNTYLISDPNVPKAMCIKILYQDVHGIVANLVVDGNEVHASSPSINTYGIYLYTSYPTNIQQEIVRNIKISNNYVHDARDGIMTLSQIQSGPDPLTYPDVVKNVKILYNDVENIGIDGILVQTLGHSSVKWNYAYQTGIYTGTGVPFSPYAIWPFYTYSIDLKFNEASYCSDANMGADGGAFDIDYDNKYITYQFNYGHDNKGPGNSTFANYYGKIINNKLKNNSAEISLEDYGSDSYVSGVRYLKIANNLLIPKITGNSAISIDDVTVGEIWIGNSFKYNKVKLDNTSQYSYMIWSNGGYNTLETRNYNTFYSAGGTTFNAYDDPNSYTWQQWQAAGYDTNGSLAVTDTGLPTNVTGLTASNSAADFAVDLSWNAASDTGSGIWHYNVHRGATSGFTPSYTNMVGETTVPRFTDTEELQGSTTYYYKVVAEDKCGNVSATPAAANVTTGTEPAPALLVWDDVDEKITYSTNWTETENLPQYFDGYVHHSNTTNDYYQFTFTGTRAKIYGSMDSNYGKADVYVDNMTTPVATKDYYDPSAKFNQLLYDTGALPLGSHTVKVKLNGQKNPSSTNYWVDVDRVEIAEAVESPYPLTNPGFETGNYTDWSQSSSIVVTGNANTGTYASKTTANNNGVYRIVTGLSPSTTYTLKAYAKLGAAGPTAAFYAKDYGGATVGSATFSGTTYSQYTLTFTTGSTNTSAEIGMWYNTGTGDVYVDDFELTRTLLTNPGFETGDYTDWSQSSSIVVTGNANTGTYASKTTANNNGVYRIVTGLSPSTAYTLKAYAKLGAAGPTANIYAKDYGGATVGSATFSGTTYSQYTLTFTTGPTNTSAEIGMWYNTGTGDVYVDDFELVR